MKSIFFNTKKSLVSRKKHTQTLTEKIVQKYVNSTTKVKAGDFISIEPHHILTHDNTSAVMEKFQSLGKDLKIKNNKQPVFALDHNVQDTSEKNLSKYKTIENFAKQQGVDFYPAGRGIGHQVMCEEGYAWPNTMVVASDSHANMYGGLGCLGTPVVRTDAASIWATGKTWWQIPPVVSCEFKGQLRQGVTGKDVIITLCGLFNKDEVLNHSIEFFGEGVSCLSLEERLTIANMTTEWGALSGVFAVDEKTVEWLTITNKKRNKKWEKRIQEIEFLKPDEGANYAKKLVLDLSTVTPHVSGPNDVKTMKSLAEIESKKIKIHKAYIVSCVNSRTQDLTEAARVFEKEAAKVHPDVEFYISAASSLVQSECEALGVWQTLLNAGAIPLPSGCGPCIGLGKGILKDNEVGISATNRNFKGRMGSRNAQAYLASPAVVAYSALKGYITSPYSYSNDVPSGKLINNVTESVGVREKMTLIDGFSKEVEGPLVWCYQDNLNTDGIYPGKYTYDESISPEKQAEVAMENYDPEFTKIVKQNSILVGGDNFGTGSSREQAATAFKYKGIRAVIAGSFSETYKRNAINNGLLVFELPELVNDLRNKYGKKKLTVVVEDNIKLNFEDGVAEFDGKVYSIPNPIGKIAQEMIVLGGLENWISKNI